MKIQPTISAFSKYVFDTVTGKIRSSSSSDLSSYEAWNGNISEENMKQYRAVASQGRWNNERYVRRWKVIHEGQAKDNTKKIYDCRFLTIGESPLRGSPDLVLESDDDRKHKTILIVERKLRTAISFQDAVVPDGTFPNVRAQLWCYAWISDWDWYRNSDVILMAEYYWRPFPYRGDVVYMGCRGVWNREDRQFNQESKKHFLAYGGSIDGRLEIPE